MLKQNNDICILGAGPAGAILALLLADKEIPCTILSKQTISKEKICGGGLSPKAIFWLKSILPNLYDKLNVKNFHITYNAIKLYAPNNKLYEIKINNDITPPNLNYFGLTFKREDFDSFLRKEVKMNKYCVFNDIKKIDYIEKKLNGYKICFDNKTIECKLIVDATGALGLLKDKFNLSKENYYFGVRGYFNCLHNYNVNCIEIHYLEDILPGYLWVFYLPNNKANVGYIVKPKDYYEISYKNLLFKLLKSKLVLYDRFNIDNLIGSIGIGKIPHSTTIQDVYDDFIIKVGDAAHITNPFNGEGISNAIISSYCAAQTIEQIFNTNADFYSRNLKTYAKILRAC